MFSENIGKLLEGKPKAKFRFSNKAVFQGALSSKLNSFIEAFLYFHDIYYPNILVWVLLRIVVMNGKYY